MALRTIDLRDVSDDFEDWYRAHQRDLIGYCARFLHDEAAAADVAQEALFRAWSRREQFSGTAEVRPWLWRVARNLCIDNIRSRQRLVPSDTLPERQAGDVYDPSFGLVLEDERRDVRQALSQLSDRHQELLYRRDVEGVAYEELASDLGVSVEGARAVLFRARRCLQHQLKAITEGAAAGLAGVRLALHGLGRRFGAQPVASAVQPLVAAAIAVGLSATVSGATPAATPAAAAPAAVAPVVQPVAAVAAAPAPAAAPMAVAGAPAAAAPVVEAPPVARPEAIVVAPVAEVAVSLETAGEASALVQVPLVEGDAGQFGIVSYREEGAEPSAVLSAADDVLASTCAAAAAVCDATEQATNLDIMGAGI